MNRIVSSSSSILICITLISSQTLPVYADIKESDNVTFQEVQDLLASGFEAADIMKDIETLSENQISFNIEDINSTDYSNEWLEDARNFIELNAANSVYTLSDYESSPASNAKATSITYAMKCAQWSIDKGRGTNFENESVYMFISHYIDRADYYWSKGDYSYLLDGESMSEHDQYFAKWLTSDDRVVYNTYMSQGQLNSNFKKMKDTYLGLSTILQDRKIYVETRANMDSMKTAMLIAKAHFLVIEPGLAVQDGWKDVIYIAETIKNMKNHDAETKLSLLYQTFIEDSNLFRNFDTPTRESVIRDSVSMAGGFVLGGVAGGVTGIGTNIISLSIDAYMDLVSTAAYAAMRYSFHARQAQRMEDYIYDMYM